MEIHSNYPIEKYNTFGIAVTSELFVHYDSESELRSFVEIYHKEYDHLRLLHVGEGSNLLFIGDYSGVILHSGISDITILEEQDDDVLVRVGAGVKHDDFVRYAIEHGWYGMENLSNIPGQVGAAAVQNIGAYGVELSDVVETVQGVSLKNGEERIWTAKQCEYSYRWSVFKSDALRGKYAITHVTFRLHRTFRPRLGYVGLQNVLSQKGFIDGGGLTAEELRRIIIDIRSQKLPDPAIQGNAGSFFMNPIIERRVYEHLQQEYPFMPFYTVDEDHVKVPAAWLIDQCGWKGRILGKVAVHDRQALVLVNLGGATGNDVVLLSDTIRRDVWERFRIELHPEVNFIYG